MFILEILTLGSQYAKDPEGKSVRQSLAVPVPELRALDSQLNPIPKQNDCRVLAWLAPHQQHALQSKGIKKKQKDKQIDTNSPSFHLLESRTSGYF